MGMLLVFDSKRAIKLLLQLTNKDIGTFQRGCTNRIEIY